MNYVCLGHSRDTAAGTRLLDLQLAKVSRTRGLSVQAGFRYAPPAGGSLYRNSASGVALPPRESTAPPKRLGPTQSCVSRDTLAIDPGLVEYVHHRLEGNALDYIRYVCLGYLIVWLVDQGPTDSLHHVGPE